jgi:hypothetical protein
VVLHSFGAAAAYVRNETPTCVGPQQQEQEQQQQRGRQQQRVRQQQDAD